MLLVLALSLLSYVVGDDDIMEIRMPGISVPRDDMYWHVQLEVKDLVYITGYRAAAKSSVVHHLLVYGCAEVPTEKVWEGGSTCRGSDGVILWAWALDAPKFSFPTNVSIEAGNAQIKYFVAQLHYKLKQPADYKDTSGVDVFFETKPTKYSAGIYLFMALEGTFPPGQQDIHMDLACNYTSPAINIFAYRTHAHSWSRLISGWREHEEEWSLIGSRDPNLSEMFVAIEEVMVVEPGDTLYARCEYDTRNTNRTISIGPTHHDEMCNLYLMYYTERSEINKIAPECVHQQTFTVPGQMQPHWYNYYVQGEGLIRTIVILIIAVLGFFAIAICARAYFCPRTTYYTKGNDGFEKLFSPMDDDDEDEVLYRSYKHPY